MGAPKSFKTGLMLKIAVELVRDGYKVYYGDCENRVRRIRNRAKQAMLEVDHEEFKSGQHDKVLNEMTKRFKSLGGDMVIDHFPAYKCNVGDIDTNLQDLKDNHGWVPDVIMIDYADLMKPIDPKITEKRLMIQHVYFDLINLNNKWGTWCMTPTPVGKKAVEAAVIKITDFSEDFGKAYNCHSA